jgi:Ca2+-binding RTX toxin-like protein
MAVKTIKLTDSANKKTTTDKDEYILARGGNDTINAKGGNDTVDGGSGDDKITGGKGDDLLIGGIGTDTAIFSGDLEDEDGFFQYNYELDENGKDIIVTDLNDVDGIDTLSEIEFLKFNDQTLTINDFIALIDGDEGNTDEVELNITPTVAAKEGNSGLTEYTFNLTLSKSSDQPVTVHIESEEDTAKAGEDFQSVNEDIEFLPGEISKSVTVLINADKIKEGDEQFYLRLSNVEGAVINGDGVGLGRILNDDTKTSSLVAMSVADLQIKEGNAGNKIAEVVVSLSGSSSKSISVNFATLNGDADDSDFTGSSGKLTFQPGDTQKIINIPILGDTESEADEAFSVLLSTVKNAQLLKFQSNVTILNDDSVTPTVTENQNPIAKNDNFTGLTADKQVTKTSADLLANDVDPDGNPLTLTSVTGASGGIVSLNNQGQVIFTPTTGVTKGSYLYAINDGKGGSSQATVNLEFLSPINNNPVAKNDTFSNLTGNQAVTKQASDLLANDTDADSGDILSITSVNNANNGTVNFSNNQVIFTPTTNTVSGSFDYTINDGKGGTSNATVSLGFVIPNQQPVAVNDSFSDKPANQPVALTAQNLLANDSDADKNDVLTVSAVAAKTGGSVTLSNGSITFTPSKDVTAGSFDYTISDGKGGTATASVNLGFKAVVVTPPTNNPGTPTTTLTKLPADTRSYDLELSLTEDIDTLDGSPSNEKFLALGGNDVINAKAGNDYIDGGIGNDKLVGEAGDDYLLGGDGNDSIYGGDGDDSIDGGLGNNLIESGNGKNIIVTGDGKNTIEGGNGDDIVTTGFGDDYIRVSYGNNIVNSGNGNDDINGVGIINAGSGNDTVSTSGKSSIAHGESGNDSMSGDADTSIYGDEGDDNLNTYYGSAYGGDGNDIISIRWSTGGGFLQGDAGKDVLIGGGNYNQTFYGGLDSDTITTGGGKGIIQYYAVTDSLVGVGNRDIVTDFDTGSGAVFDLYRLSDSALTFLGSKAFDGTKGAVRFAIDSVNKWTLVQVDMNGDSTPDMEIELTGLKVLSADDFTLVKPG